MILDSVEYKRACGEFFREKTLGMAMILFAIFGIGSGNGGILAPNPQNLIAWGLIIAASWFVEINTESNKAKLNFDWRHSMSVGIFTASSLWYAILAINLLTNHTFSLPVGMVAFMAFATSALSLVGSHYWLGSFIPSNVDFPHAGSKKYA